MFNSNNRYAENSNDLFNAIRLSVNNGNSENVEALDNIENKEPIVNSPVNNESRSDPNEFDS